MEERKRLVWAMASSIVVHLIVLSTVSIPAHHLGAGRGATEEPIVVRLERVTPESIKDFIDTFVPAQEPVDPRTDLISDKNAKASDLDEVEGTRPAP
jgi:hypothetical protein